LIRSIHNWIRRLFSLRKPRALPRRGPKPAIGSGVYRADVRMTLQAGFSDELWHWLLEEGWRELRYRPDRRRYREITTGWVNLLIDAAPEERRAVLEEAIKNAIRRPVIERSGVPSYVTRE